MVLYLVVISMQFIPRAPHIAPALAQPTAWHRTDGKPLPEPIMTQSIKVCVCY